jgi:hypothetical protein
MRIRVNEALNNHCLNHAIDSISTSITINSQIVITSRPCYKTMKIKKILIQYLYLHVHDESHIVKYFNYIIIFRCNPLGVLGERWRSLHDVTKEVTVRRGVRLYCDVILWDTSEMIHFLSIIAISHEAGRVIKFYNARRAKGVIVNLITHQLCVISQWHSKTFISIFGLWYVFLS